MSLSNCTTLHERENHQNLDYSLDLVCVRSFFTRLYAVKKHLISLHNLHERRNEHHPLARPEPRAPPCIQYAGAEGSDRSPPAIRNLSRNRRGFFGLGQPQGQWPSATSMTQCPCSAPADPPPYARRPRGGHTTCMAGGLKGFWPSLGWIWYLCAPWMLAIFLE